MKLICDSYSLFGSLVRVPKRMNLVAMENRVTLIMSWTGFSRRQKVREFSHHSGNVVTKFE